MDTDESKWVEVGGCVLATFRSLLLIAFFFKEIEIIDSWESKIEKNSKEGIEVWKLKRTQFGERGLYRKICILRMLCLRSCGSFKKRGYAILLLSQEIKTRNRYGY